MSAGKKDEQVDTIAGGRGLRTDDVPQARRFGFEWKTRTKLFRLPLVCISYGLDEQGRVRVAKGLIAVGQFAVGGIAIGQFAAGIVSIGQVGLGLVAFGQLGLALVVAFAQVAVGPFAVGQAVFGMYARGQIGWASFLWSPGHTDMEAVAMFETIKWWFQQDVSVMWDSLRFSIELGIKALLDWFE